MAYPMKVMLFAEFLGTFFFQLLGGTQSIALLDEKSPYKGLKVTYKDGDICKKQVTTRRAARATCRCVLLRMCAVLPWCCRMAGAAASARHCRR